MIMKLKMHTTGKMFDKIYLTAIRDTIFQYVVCSQREGEGEAWQKVRAFGFLVGRFRAVSSLSLSCKSWSLIENTLRSVLCLITVIILKRVREIIYLQSNKFTACKVRDEKVVAKFLMTFNLQLSIHLIVRSI